MKLFGNVYRFVLGAAGLLGAILETIHKVRASVPMFIMTVQ